MVGNDIVDLADGDCAAGAGHRRFDARVFAPEERRRLSLAPDAGALRWVLWAAKESAYKAARQWRPETVFSPSRFVVSVDAAGRGEVRHGDERYALRVNLRGDCIHAVATAPAPAGPTALAGMERLPAAGPDGATPEEPGRAVRRLALTAIAQRLALPAGRLRLDRRDRIPRLWRDGTGPAGWLSLSHHGRFVGFAFRGPAGAEALQ